MQRVWVQLGGATAIAALTLLGTASLLAAQEAGVKTAAEELDKRSKPAEGASGGQQGKLSDSSVRVMSGLAWSIMPDDYKDAAGKTVKIDKSDANKSMIPVDDARRIIRIATRSAYAEVCGLEKLEEANYTTMMQAEEARKVWSMEQMIFINRLHMFAVSYFTGNMTITEQDDGAKKDAPATQNGEQAAKAPEANAAAGTTAGDEGFKPKKLTCTPEQKEKVTKSITAYVQSAKAEAPQGAKPAAPAASDAPKTTPAAPQAAPAPAGAAN
jgi:hypothetical protein